MGNVGSEDERGLTVRYRGTDRFLLTRSQLSLFSFFLSFLFSSLPQRFSLLSVRIKLTAINEPVGSKRIRLRGLHNNEVDNERRDKRIPSRMDSPLRHSPTGRKWRKHWLLLLTRTFPGSNRLRRVDRGPAPRSCHFSETEQVSQNRVDVSSFGKEFLMGCISRDSFRIS